VTEGRIDGDGSYGFDVQRRTSGTEGVVVDPVVVVAIVLVCTLGLMVIR
jgi:hypothetical protein